MFNDLINLIYPNTCVLCGNSLAKIESKWCFMCDLSLPKTFHWHSDSNRIFDPMRAEYPISFGGSFLYFKKGNNVQQLINLLKYKGDQEIGFKLGAEFGKELKGCSLLKNVDVIIPVPLHSSKFMKRGYNQSELIAKGLSSELEFPVSNDSLIRTVKNKTQTTKSRYDRWLNVEHIFDAINQDKLINKHVLLVDDVYTTGSTIGSCLKTLFQIEGITVSISTIACAD